MPTQQDDLAQAPLEVFYMKMLTDNADARLGKLQAGQIVPMDRAKATRYLTTGVAEQASSADYEAQQGRKAQKATAAQERFRALNQGADVWDVATYRDVLTAPESGLRIAHARGIPLINVHMLRDEDGDVLAPDSDIEDILDARKLMHPDLLAPLAAHGRSSVMGGGSPYGSNVNPGLGTPMPLSPQHRAMMEKIAEQERFAQQPSSYSYDRNDPKAKEREATANEERANRAARRSAPRETVEPESPNPKVPNPPVSPRAEQAAKDEGVRAPSSELTRGQRGN